MGKQQSGDIRLSSTSFSLTPISGASGEIISLSLSASQSATMGTATLSNIIFVTSNSEKITMSDATFRITIGTPSPAIAFADANVKAICVQNWDTNGDGELSEDEAAVVTDLGTVFKGNTEITSFEELQYFTGLTSLGNYAFYGCTELTSIVVPEGTQSLGDFVFFACYNLEHISLPQTLKRLGAGVFRWNHKLKSITIPKSVTDCSSAPIWGCDSLESVIVEEGNPVYDSRNNCNAIIETSTNTLVNGCKATVIPDGITTIGVHALVEQGQLKEITIPNSVNKICFRAFWLTGLSSVSIPESVTTIEAGAFNCNDLIKVFVFWPEPLAIEDAFNSASANATLYVPAGSKAAYEVADYWKEFKEIIEIVPPSPTIEFADANVKAICVANWDANADGELSEEEAAAVTDLGTVFKGNTEITSFEELQYFTGLTGIGDDTFQHCIALTSLIIPESVTSIGSHAFYNCI